MSNVNTRIIQGMIMPTGWHYMQPLPVGGTTRIDSHDCESLIQAIVDFRMNNMMPIGDPLADLEHYVCDQWPTFCHSVPGAIVNVQVNVGADRAAPQTFVDRMVLWMEQQTNDLGQHSLVLSGEAQRRADICKRCNLNMPWRTSCGTCNGNVDRVATMLRQGNELPNHDGHLKACRILAQENRTAVWMRRERLGHDASLPAHCWLKDG